MQEDNKNSVHENEDMVRIGGYFSKDEDDWITKKAKERKVSKSYILRELVWEKMKEK